MSLFNTTSPPTTQALPSLRSRVLLSDYTSWRVGGVAKRLYQPGNIEELAVFLSTLPASEPLTWLGAGTNVLIRDGGLLGTVIVVSDKIANWRVSDSTQVIAEAGMPAARFAMLVTEAGLAGAEFLAGIPGSLGGALAMNAGAYGAEIWNYVEQVEVINRQGQRFIRSKSDYEISYRHVVVPEGEWFVAGYFRFSPGDSERSRSTIRDMLAKRRRSQPLEWPSAGCVFRNPPNDYAARLIETAGMKGHRIGGACVSQKHANFIVNDQSATAADIERLIEAVEQEVLRVHQVNLVREVRILGNALK